MAKKILVIDDEALVTSSLRKLFKKEGYEVCTADNYHNALKEVKNNDFSLVVSDIRIPGEDGIEIIKGIRKHLQENNKPLIPEILITGYASEDKYQSAIDLKVKAYINKPFDIQELLEAVKGALGES